MLFITSDFGQSQDASWSFWETITDSLPGGKPGSLPARGGDIFCHQAKKGTYSVEERWAD